MSANLIRSFRDEYRLSQAELGVLVGRSRASIAAYESGTQPADGAVTGMLHLLSGRPHHEILERVRSSKAPIGDETMKSLTELLCEVQTTTAEPVLATALDGPWRVNRGGVSRQYRLSDIERMATVGLAQGGALTHEATKAALGPLVISSRLSRLGARYLSADGTLSDFNVPLMSDPQSWWVGEDASVPEAVVNFSLFTGRYHTVATNLALSRQLLRLAGDAGVRTFAGAIVRGLAREVDRAILMGTGLAGQPMGITATPGLPQIDNGIDSIANTFRDAVETLELAGCDSERIAVIAHPSTKKKLAALEAEFGEVPWTLAAPGTGTLGQVFRGYRALTSASYPEGKLLVGDFSQVTIRVRDEVDVRVIDAGRSDGAHVIYAFLDIGLENPFATSAFIEITGV